MKKTSRKDLIACYKKIGIDITRDLFVEIFASELKIKTHNF